MNPPEGFRSIFYITGGEVSGPKLRGKLRPVRADWFTIRTDGMAIVDVRSTIETHDGALIYVDYRGVVDLGENGYQKFLRGESPPSGLPIRANPRSHTAHPNHRWLNRLFCLGIGQTFLDRSEVIYDVYAVR
ncbi:MAG: DUF3237 domain-containing protein [Ignavibacteriales bacterium]